MPVNFNKVNENFQKNNAPRRFPPRADPSARGPGPHHPRRVHRPIQIHRHRPDGALRNPGKHHPRPGYSRIRLREQPALHAVEQPLRHQVQARLDRREGLPRRRRQGRVLPGLPHGRGLVPRPRRVPRQAAPLRLAVRLRLGRLQELGARAQGCRLRHGPPTTRSGSSASSRRASSSCSTAPTARRSTPAATGCRAIPRSGSRRRRASGRHRPPRPSIRTTTA